MHIAWWRHQMETFSALLAICAGNSPVTGEFPAQRPVTRSFDLFFDRRLNERFSKHSWGWWFETLSRPLWRHCNGLCFAVICWGLDMTVPSYSSGSAFIKPDQRNPWIKDQLGNALLSTILHLQLPNFVSCGRACPSHMTQNLVTVGAKL